VRVFTLLGQVWGPVQVNISLLQLHSCIRVVLMHQLFRPVLVWLVWPVHPEQNQPQNLSL
jgi:hypothetical protein